MPTYDYECGACGHTCEVFQSITEAPKRKCPECGKQRFKRLIGAGAGVIFKGSGFYETDYRSADYKKRAKADGDTKNGEKKSSETKSSEKSGSSDSSKSSDSGKKGAGEAGGSGGGAKTDAT